MRSGFILEEELKKLPDHPGVYLMHDESDEIIYIGKARSLRHRVRQYFRASHSEGLKKDRMVQKIAWFEYILTDTELEALVLECNLIKEHTPRYNTMLRDDKTYPYIRVTLHEAYPRLLSSRRLERGKDRYFGPYTSAFAVKETLELLNGIFGLRTCSKKLPKEIGKGRPCLNYHIGRCPGVCKGTESEEEYRKRVDAALDFLGGNSKDLIRSLEAQMKEASDAMDFEKAAQLRDLISSVKHVTEKQKITTTGGEERDIVAAYREGEEAVVSVFFIRSGKLLGREHYYVSIRLEETMPEIMSVFLRQYYSGTPYIPKEICLRTEPEDRQQIEEWLSERKEQQVQLLVPQRGVKNRLLVLAENNAKEVLTNDRERLKREEGRTIGAVHELEELLGLSGLSRMEAFDISNTSGFQSVASMVVFEKGKPKKNDYRKFRLKTVTGPDDYASMEEVLTRRLTRAKEEGTALPDLILMDGGKGQVNVAKKVLSALSLSIPVCGMVKDDFHRTRGLYFENNELPIDRHSEGFKLITRIQDEAHRFAITYHRALRGKEQTHSVLDDIKGIGEARRKALMRSFRSLEEIREADAKKLAEVPGMNQKAAQAVFDYFHPAEDVVE